MPLSETVDTNDGAAKTSALTLSGESIFTLYVTPVSGNHDNHETTLEFSPDGTHWLASEYGIIGLGQMTVSCCAHSVRGCVRLSEGAASSSKLHIFAG